MYPVCISFMVLRLVFFLIILYFKTLKDQKLWPNIYNGHNFKKCLNKRISITIFKTEKTEITKNLLNSFAISESTVTNQFIRIILSCEFQKKIFLLLLN